MRHSSCRITLDVYTRTVDQQKREASLKVVGLMLPVDLQKFQHPSAPSARRRPTGDAAKHLLTKDLFGGSGRDRTDDLFHVIDVKMRF
jgi:hypothetical protein